MSSATTANYGLLDVLSQAPALCQVSAGDSISEICSRQAYLLALQPDVCLPAPSAHMVCHTPVCTSGAATLGCKGLAGCGSAVPAGNEPMTQAGSMCGSASVIMLLGVKCRADASCLLEGLWSLTVTSDIQAADASVRPACCSTAGRQQCYG